MTEAVKSMRSGLTRVAVISLGLVLGFGALEIGLRAYALLEPGFGGFVRGLGDRRGEEAFTQYVAHPLLPYIMRPSSELTINRPDLGSGAKINVRTNAYGFRAHELSTEKDANELRIFCLGESTTFGANAADNETTWPERLEARLAARFPDRRIRVFNLGMSLATSAYSVVTLGTLAVHFKPDLIIVYHGFNEYDAATTPGFRDDHAHYFRDFDPRRAWLGLLRSLPDWACLSYAIVLSSELFDQIVGVKTMRFHMRHMNFQDAEDPMRGIASGLETFRTMRSIARGVGARILFSTFQFYAGRDPSARLYNDSLRAFFDANDFLYVDQDALIPDYDRSINVDDCHFTPAGEKLMAENFYEFIVSRHLIAE